MSNNTNDLRDPRQRGSALLIVLGFLSFMMISAVAFAIYMRIERQASSNYRHAASARHMLNSALYRAMDEIDSELRAVNVSGRGPNPRKFPTWPGRVRTSAVVNSADNGGNARVLTLGALSYIPGIFLNDVRYYAVKPSNVNASQSYKGAKWRPLSMPLMNMEGLNAYEEAVVGRYAYICVNLSDMLNVNLCKAAVRDADLNRISIGHLFKDDAQRKAFDERLKDTDISYSTLQDFYACMFDLADTTIFNSPWHEYLDTGDDWLPFRSATKHILMTDGVVRAEPVANPEPHNILTVPPIRDADLTNLQPMPDVAFQGAFGATLNRALTGNIIGGAAGSINTIMPTLLADYIDDDDVPKALNMPSVEMTPMISQISAPPLAQAFITTRAAKNADGDDINIYTLDFTRLNGTFVNVEVMWPFKNSALRTRTPGYTVEVLAYLKVNKVHAAQKSDSFQQPPVQAQDFLVELKGSATAPNQWNSTLTDPEQACRVVNVNLVPTFNTPGGTPNLDLIDSEGTVYPGFTAGTPISVSLVLAYARIRNNDNNKYVDCAPTMLKFPGQNGITPFEEFAAVQKLFFQSKPSPPLSDSMAVPFDLTYDEWKCLEIADPRFNWKASNWIKSDVPEADGRLNTSTKDLLALNDGRDADIFMSVSNAGKLQSPGELGYLIRPFAYEIAGPAVDFRTHDDPAGCQDFEAMFRTIRLYDHGDPGDPINRRHDKIYQNFIAANADGSLRGARVNPLSDISLVLGAAVERVPLDYWVSYQITDTIEKGNDVPQKFMDANFSELMKGNSWRNFTNGWANCLFNVRNVSDINTDLSRNLRDEYSSHQYFGWHSASDPEKVIEPTPPQPGTPVVLSNPMHEIDRKMLYSFTLDSFSDRQQLFLYIISAEATAAALGDSVNSLAGGKAIALVWRDPYPIDYNSAGGGSFRQFANMYNNSRISPWHQDYKGVDDNKFEYYDNDQHSLGRTTGYHEQKILYFQYLDN